MAQNTKRKFPLILDGRCNKRFERCATHCLVLHILCFLSNFLKVDLLKTADCTLVIHNSFLASIFVIHELFIAKFYLVFVFCLINTLQYFILKNNNQQTQLPIMYIIIANFCFNRWNFATISLSLTFTWFLLKWLSI